MDLDQIKQDIVTASHILHQQGIAAAFGHVSARIPGTETFIFPPRMSPALVRPDNLLLLDVEGNQLAGDGRIRNFGSTRAFIRPAPTCSRFATFIRRAAS
jgi:ribulose-5-phosphate 4-epimerase/fuculose-1-phosphate aldolase